MYQLIDNDTKRTTAHGNLASAVHHAMSNNIRSFNVTLHDTLVYAMTGGRIWA